MTKFHELGLAKPIQRAVQQLGYETPSPIQAKMIPVLLEGHDAIGIAQTGTGKTAAFLLPLLNVLSGIKSRPKKGKCDVLILTPTRELASQILENARNYGQNMKFASALIVGGARYEGQLRALAKGVNLIVATPGRLIDHIETGAADLSDVRFVVLDEADQMLDMGFVPAIREIMSHVPDERQTILTSATMPKPIEKLTKELLRNPQKIAVSRESQPARNVVQEILFVDKPQKPAQLREILETEDWSKVIIFTRTKRGADKVQVQLIKSGIIAQSLHGDKSFGQRRHIMEEFKSGEVTVLVATDLAGRGLDIDDVSLVINYDMPNIAESYVHRIGRTGRAGRSGKAISLVDRSEKAYLRDIETLMGLSLGGTQGQAKAEPKQKSNQDGKPAKKGEKKPSTRKDSQKSFKGKSSKGRDDRAKAGKGKFEKRSTERGRVNKDKQRSQPPAGDSFWAKEFEGQPDKPSNNPKKANAKPHRGKSNADQKPRRQKPKKGQAAASDARQGRSEAKKTGLGRMKRSANFKKSTKRAKS